MALPVLHRSPEARGHEAGRHETGPLRPWTSPVRWGRSRTRRIGRFDYRMSLPADIELEQVSAVLANGVLTVRVPKTEQARPRKIPISC